MRSVSLFITLLSLIVDKSLTFQPSHLPKKSCNQCTMASKNVEIKTEDAPDPLGPYSQAVLAGNTLYCSGNIAIDPKTGDIVGNGDVQEETRQVLKNMDAVLKKGGASPSNVVRCTVFLDDLQNFVSFQMACMETMESDKASALLFLTMSLLVPFSLELNSPCIRPPSMRYTRNISKIVR